MKNCEQCKEIISEKDLPSVFHITVGELKDDMFYGSESTYYHKECLTPLLN